MNSEKPFSKILDVNLLPTTGGETLVKYRLSELGTVFELTQGIYGQVFDFDDGGSIVYAEDGSIISFHEDSSITIYDHGEIDFISANPVNDNNYFFYKVVMRALRGNEEFGDEDYLNI